MMLMMMIIIKLLSHIVLLSAFLVIDAHNAATVLWQ